VFNFGFEHMQYMHARSLLAGSFLCKPGNFFHTALCTTHKTLDWWI